MIAGPARLLIAALNVAILGGMGGSLAASAETEASRIVVKDFMFMPMSLTVKAGSTVTWVNMDDEPHTVVSNTQLFRSGALDTKETFSFKFTEPGTYHFTCSIHPRMVGIIVVQ
ncbi:MAG: cupredoxin family copper-binding protein [Steroidobacteraceae bacterium]